MKEIGFQISADYIAKSNETEFHKLNTEFEYLKNILGTRKIDIKKIVDKVRQFSIAIPSWGTGVGGTRFAKFPILGEPRDVFDKLVDCKTVNTLTGLDSPVSLHLPWDKVEEINDLISFANEMKLKFGPVNSNTFQDQIDQKLSYKYGGLSNTDQSIRKQAIDHHIECIEIGKKIGSKALSIWIGDGGSFPGQIHFRKSFERYIDSLKEVYKHLPDNWKMFIEHKLFEPAFYSTVLNDWGSSYIAVNILGEKALSLVDLGHHAPNTNIEMIVARLIQFGKLAGFHFNDSKYGDDDLDTGSINPYQLFLVFNELVDAEDSKVPGFAPEYMIDQSHNITDPIESLLVSVEEIQKAYIKALLINRVELDKYQESNDPLMALRILKEAYDTDVTPIIEMARYLSKGAIKPVSVFRASCYREKKVKERS